MCWSKLRQLESVVVMLVSGRLPVCYIPDTIPRQLHTYSHGGVGHNFIKEPQVLGHESAGVIVTIGANVTNLKVGDRVAIEPTRFCRK